MTDEIDGASASDFEENDRNRDADMEGRRKGKQCSNSDARVRFSPHPSGGSSMPKNPSPPPFGGFDSAYHDDISDNLPAMDGLEAYTLFQCSDHAK